MRLAESSTVFHEGGTAYSAEEKSHERQRKQKIKEKHKREKAAAREQEAARNADAAAEPRSPGLDRLAATAGRWFRLGDEA